MALTVEEAQEIALVASKVALDVWETKRKHANERIRGMKAIAIELGCTDRHLSDLVKEHGFPLDHDPAGGYSVARWELERWMESRRISAQEHRRRAEKKGK